ncbi:MAG: HAD-IIB family hydrolase [Erysipelotrichaceae bacterium]|nr:HAD-IIB family hydrolase [Erysipelotrichaceae bacterium]
MKKYFFFDIDGTLTDLRTGRFVDSALAAIAGLQQNGHFTAIATGRACYKTLPAMESTGIHNAVANGGAALIIDDALVKNSPLDREKALRIIREADALGYGILAAYNDSTDVFMRDHRFLEQAGERREPTVYHYDPDRSFEDLPEIYKIYISVPAEEEYRLVNRDLLGHIRMGGPYFWYQHDRKDEGIREMMKYLNADPKDAVVFGDGENDEVMFGREWFSIAMGNGWPGLMKQADYITDASVDDGVYNACVHFGWIKGRE